MVEGFGPDPGKEKLKSREMGLNANWEASPHPFVATDNRLRERKKARRGAGLYDILVT